MRPLPLFLLVFSLVALSPAQGQTPPPATALEAFVSAVAGDDVGAAAKMLTADPGLIAAAAASDRAILYDALNDRSVTGETRRAMVALLLDKGADPNRSGQRLIDTPLIAAEQNADADMVALLLDRGADPNMADLRGVTPLARALANNQNQIALRLIAKGVNPNARDARGWTPLHVAAGASHADAAVMQALLDRGGDVNARAGSVRAPFLNSDWAGGSLDARGLTPLHIAAFSGRADLVKLLIAHGANLEARTDDGNMPLHEAAQTLSPTVALLLASGANPQARNRVGDQAIHLAVRAGASGPEAQAALTALIARSDLAARDQFGLTPLLLALTHHNIPAEAALRTAGDPSPTVLAYDAAARNDVAALNRSLARQPYLVTARLPNGWTLLHLAALWGAADTAGGLLAKGADVRAGAAQGETPLGLALRNWTGAEPNAGARRALVNLLVRAGANVNHMADGDDPPLLRAAVAGDESLVTLLLAHKANPNVPSVRGDFPLWAAVSGPPGVTARLLAAGADINAWNSDGETALQRAVRIGRKETAALLLAAGADPRAGLPVPAINPVDPAPFLRAEAGDAAGVAAALDMDPSLIQASDGSGDTLLHKAFGNDYASPHGLLATVRLLILRGANVNARNQDGQTPLHLAASNSSPESGLAAAMLLHHGADAGARDRSGKTPLHRAATTALAALLLGAGASVNARDNAGDTPLHCAAAWQPSIIPILLSRGADADARNDDGETPLHLALQHPGNALPLPLIKKSNLTLPDRFGMSPLQRLIGPSLSSIAAARGLALPSPLAAFQAAAVNDVPRLARLLGSQPTLLYARLPDGTTLLHLAASGRARGAALLLLVSGADVNARDARAVTPLLATLQMTNDRPGVRAMTALLLAHGADVNAVSGQGGTALHQAFRTADPGLFALLLAHHPNVNTRDPEGNAPLHLCVCRSSVRPLLPQLAGSLIANGADLNAWGGLGLFGDAGLTPLETAISSGRDGLARYFVARGADSNAPGANGETPLMLANRLHNAKMAAYLTAHGAH